jgi:enoyl-CoA hydratase/carnithine racemase
MMRAWILEAGTVPRAPRRHRRARARRSMSRPRRLRIGDRSATIRLEVSPAMHGGHDRHQRDRAKRHSGIAPLNQEQCMSEEQVVTYELEDEIALVGLNRPDKRNCFNPDVMKALLEAIVRAGEEAKCGIIFGHGDNFCAGLDLRWAAESWKTGRSERLPFPFNRNSYFEAMARGNIPFIAALHGATLGGGLETAAAAHIRVADETTFFALPEGTRGIFIGGGGSVRVARLLGFARMQDMMLTGRVLKPDEAERYGIVQYVVPKGEAMAKAKELATKIRKNAPLSNFAITNSLPRLQDMSYDDGLFFERMVAEYTRSPESIERLNQFLDKTAPRVRMPE